MQSGNPDLIFTGRFPLISYAWIFFVKMQVVKCQFERENSNMTFKKYVQFTIAFNPYIDCRSYSVPYGTMLRQLSQPRRIKAHCGKSNERSDFNEEVELYVMIETSTK